MRARRSIAKFARPLPISQLPPRGGLPVYGKRQERTAMRVLETFNIYGAWVAPSGS